jgi:hypothetical protein
MDSNNDRFHFLILPYSRLKFLLKSHLPLECYSGEYARAFEIVIEVGDRILELERASLRLGEYAMGRLRHFIRFTRTIAQGWRL